ncbi:MAG: hypothetical protein RL077_5731 [Verrucomicrobiota bacterium]|jgi:acyl carrier protein
MHDRIVSVFREVFDNPALDISDASSAQDVPEWDSLAQVKLIIGLEEEFRIKFTTNEVAEMKCVADLKAALSNKGAR